MKPSIPFSHRAAVAALTLSVLAAGCGSDDEVVSATTVVQNSAAEVTTTEAAATASTTTLPTTVESTEAMAEEAAFPVTVEHKLGTITVDEMPERVVSIGYKDQDWLYEFGVRPLAVRSWYGVFPGELNPWAADAAGGEIPQVLEGELNFEEIAALNPDLIVGVYSGITEEDYELLSAIAPTLAGPVGTSNYEEPWRDMTRLIGAALGQADEADALVAEIEGLYADVRAEHPEFDGVKIVAGAAWGEVVGVYDSGDPRSQLLGELGFVFPARFDELTDGEFWFELSQEAYTELDEPDVAVLLSYVENQVGRDLLRAEPVYANTTLHLEDRTVFLDTVDSDVAFSFLSPSSIRYMLSYLVPALEAAVDGDPSTMIPDLPDYTAQG